MGYVDENLISDEVVTYRGQLHWLVLVWPAIIAGFVIAVGVVLLFRALNDQANTAAWLIAALVLLAIGDIPLIAALIKKRSAEFAVTNKRVILKEGVIRRRTAEMFLSKVESVGVDQTVIGRVFRYGSIVIRGTGGSTEPFHLIADPLEFRRQVQEQIAKLHEQPAGRA